jgi:hypothetical protein
MARRGRRDEEAAMKRGKTGQATGTMYVTPARARAYVRKLRAEEKRWRSLNGPVVVTRIEQADREILPTDREILPTSINKP